MGVLAIRDSDISDIYEGKREAWGWFFCLVASLIAGLHPGGHKVKLRIILLERRWRNEENVKRHRGNYDDMLVGADAGRMRKSSPTTR